MRTRIKMCGTTRLEDALAAVDAGVDALGFIFVDKSPRCVGRDLVCSIVDRLPPFITTVGVFVDSSLEEVKQSVTSCGLNQVQLHGNEEPGFCEELQDWNRSCSICKAFRIGEGSIPDNIDAYTPVIDSVLLDTYVKGLEGGTGEAFDLDLLDLISLQLPLILAGGLNPDNAAEAVRQVAPFAIDINSGVEKAPGKKDHQLIRQLIRRVRAVDT